MGSEGKSSSETLEKLQSISSALDRLSMKMSCGRTDALNNISKFVPDTQQTIAEYLDNFSSICLAHNLDSVDMIRILPLRLTGRARAVFDEISEANKRTWTTFVAKMVEKLDSKLSRDLTLAGSDDQWKESDIVTSYSERLRKYCNRLYCGMPADALNKITRDIFLKSLPHHIWVNVIRYGDEARDSFDDAVRTALKEEKLIEKKNSLEQKISVIEKKTQDMENAVAMMIIDYEAQEEDINSGYWNSNDYETNDDYCEEDEYHERFNSTNNEEYEGYGDDEYFEDEEEEHYNNEWNEYYEDDQENEEHEEY